MPMRRTTTNRIAIFTGVALLGITAVATVQANTLLNFSGLRSIGLYHSTLTIHDAWDSDYPVRDKETIRKTFELTGAQKSLQLDNVNGNIEIVGTDSNQIQLVVNKAIRAKTDAKLEQARKEVTLEIKQDAGSLQLYVDGPFRCRCDH